MNICGDNGIGRNFAVITCESCKAFFRRFGLRNKILNCPSNGNCNINTLTRKSCQKCRLEKCFALGMRKDFIRSDEENDKRRKLIRENKLKHENCVHLTETSISSVSSFTDSSNDLIIFDENKEKDILDELLDNTIDINLDELNAEITDIENSITDIKINDESLENQINKNIAIVPMFREITDYNGLNELENNRVSELTSAAVVLNYNISENIIQLNSFEEVVKMCSPKQECFAVDMVNFIKSLSGFNRICCEDRVALMKHGFNELIGVRSLKYYNKHTENYYMPLDEVNTAQINLSVLEFGHVKYAEKLTAIILYNPNRPNLMHKQSVKLEQQLDKKWYKICEVCGDKGIEKDILDEILDNTIDINMDEINDEIKNIEQNITNNLMSTIRVKQKCENTAIVPMFREITDYNGLNELENNRLSELSSAAVEMLRGCGPRQEGSVQDIIQFIKSLSGFNRICSEDRVALMKYGYNQLLSIRTLKYYNKSSANFYVPLYCKDEANTFEFNLRTRTTTLVYTLNKLCDKKLHKICEVCGDKGNGRNFGVITCESCKAFFRRFGLKNKPLNCPSNGKCNINQMTRKICQRCRLEKCFAVGMKKEFIRSDEENEKRKEIIRENKLKREKCNDLTDSSVSSVYSFTDSSNDLIIFDENKEKDILDELLDNTIDINMNEICDEMIEIGKKIHEVIKQVKQKCENTAIVPMFREITDYNGLNELESNRISELTSAAVHLAISKSVQLALLKCGYNELLSIRYLKCLDEWNYDDPTAIDLLTAIIFYNPNRPNLMHKHNVKLEQQLYIYLLQRYLLWKYRSDSESRMKYGKLMYNRFQMATTLGDHMVKPFR
ncbi:unnamed protein product, partial [Medioppia subpectinata]